MTVLEWKEGQTHLDFIGQLTPERPFWQAQLSVDVEFVSAFGKLAPAQAQELAAAMVTAPVFMTTLKNVPTTTMARRSATRRFDALCLMLGNMQQVKTLHVNSDDGFLSVNHAKIIGSMQQVKTMSIWGRQTNQDAMQELAQGLAQHGQLDSLRLAIPSTFYHLVLPAVYGIKSLTKLVLHKHVALQSEIVPQVAHAMAGLLRMGRTNPNLRLELEHWDFTNIDSNNTFCQALAETLIRSIDLCGCSFVSPTTLALALTHSKLREIKFSLLRFSGRSVAEFLTCLTRDISTMQQLEELECGQFDSRGDFGSNDDAVVQLTHAVARCHRLRCLRLNFHKYPQHADAALAECFKPANSRLVELQVRCISLDSDMEPRVTESPALLEALKKNFTVRRIRLHSAAQFGRYGEAVIDPWDPLLKKNIEMFAKLNCAGRNYMTRDSMDKVIGSRFLGAVSNDLDCLFYHLSRENPSLCDRHTSGTEAGGRKRRRATGDVIMLDFINSMSLFMYDR